MASGQVPDLPRLHFQIDIVSEQDLAVRLLSGERLVCYLARRGGGGGIAPGGHDGFEVVAVQDGNIVLAPRWVGHSRFAVPLDGSFPFSICSYPAAYDRAISKGGWADV